MLLLPLILIEIYLIATLLFLQFGPVIWRLENAPEFWLLIFLYHIAFIAGYLLSLKKFKPNQKIIDNHLKTENFIVKNFWPFVTIAFIGSIISYKNTVHSDSYIPYDFFTDFYVGLTSPGLARHEFISSLDSYVSNKFVTIFYSTIVVFKYSMIPVLTILWDKLKFHERLIGFSVAIIPFIATVSIGTNKLVFDTLLIFLVMLIVQVLSASKEKRMDSLKKRKFIILFIVFLALFFPYYFNKVMTERSADFRYMEHVSTAGNIQISTSSASSFFSSLNLPMPIEEFLVKVDFYVAQGYYGMSLAIDEKFDSTYGIGHSYFLLDQFKYFFGVDLIEKTFQYKINDQWDRLVQWHSFYSQAANDVGFYGVVILMFVIGYIFSMVYTSAIKESNLTAKALLPLFVIMFIYMPANNQVFNFMETLFSFLVLIMLWILERHQGNYTFIKKFIYLSTKWRKLDTDTTHEGYAK